MEEENQEKITLPLSMLAIAECVGFDAAIVIMDNFGGLSSFYIPRVAVETHKMAALKITKSCVKSLAAKGFLFLAARFGG